MSLSLPAAAAVVVAVVAVVAVVVAVVVVVVDVSFRLVRVLWLIELFFGGFGTEWNSSGTSEQLNGRP